MPAPNTSQHFNRLAPSYSRVRGAPEYIRPLADAIATCGDVRGRRVLDVGCGSGALLAELRARYSVHACGIDGSRGMAKAARAELSPDVPIVVGRAEQLPFREAAFERVTMSLVVHLLDRPRALREAVRVLLPGGRLVVASVGAQGVDEFWLRRYFPSYAAIEQQRFPTPEALCGEAKIAGFARVSRDTLALPRTFSRAAALEKLRERAYSTFEFIDEDEYRRGLRAAEADLPDPVRYTLTLLLVVAERR